MITIRATRLACVLVAGALVGGCASSARHAGLTSRPIALAEPDSSAPAPDDSPVPLDSLEAVMRRIRELSTQASPREKQSPSSTIESHDRNLEAALLALKTFPGAESHRRVADAYARIGVLDAAQTHYRSAVAIDRQDGAAYDGLARLWRDAGLPTLALGDAHRAVYFEPESAEARNTLGTVLQALGQHESAREAYETVLALQPGAAYALNNLGYLSLVAGDPAAAIGYCQEAIAADSTLVAARHNLALAYAVTGRMDLVRQALRNAGPAARADYNEGIINLSLGRSAAALAAFEAACQGPGGPTDSCNRARALRTVPAKVDGGTE